MNNQQAGTDNHRACQLHGSHGICECGVETYCPECGSFPRIYDQIQKKFASITKGLYPEDTVTFTVKELREAMLESFVAGSESKITENTSDGYHTFKELYEHRITLFIALLRKITMLLPASESSHIWKSKLHSDGTMYDGWFILGIYKEPGKQITYHLPIDKWNETQFAEPLDKAPEWDGHTPEDVIKRLQTL